MSENVRRWAAAGLLMLLVAFAAGRTLFVHTHVGPDGLVSHSHPFLPGDHHSHSAAEFTAIAQAMAQAWDDDEVAAPAVHAPAPVCIAVVALRPVKAECGRDAAPAALRAPPQV